MGLRNRSLGSWVAMSALGCLGLGVVAGACGPGGDLAFTGGGTTTTSSSTSGAGGAPACAPGQQIACACPGGTQGVQVCLQDGTGYGLCDCGGSTSSTGGTGGTGTTTSSTSSTSSTGGAGVCTPGSTQECYTGPAATKGIGICVPGVETCNADGSGYGSCMGDVTPQTEKCATAVDDNCNGQVNEGCACMPGMTEACYDGPAGTAGVGPCKGGMHTCGADGRSYGPCTGEVLPAPESCMDSIDNDCNGQINEGGAGCVCSPNVATPCYDGPAGSENVGACKGGMSTCNMLGTALGPCVGQVLPQMENCATPQDESCDGSPGPCPIAGWSKGAGNYYDIGFALAVDSLDEVIVAGSFQGSLDFGAGPLMAGGMGSNAFVVKLSSAGDVIWQKAFACTASGGVQAYGVAVDTAGNIALTGNFSGSMSFGGPVLTVTGADPNTRDAYVAKLDAQGNHIFSRGFGGLYDQDTGNGVAFDANGNLLVTGGVLGQVDFGAGVVACGLAPNIYVAKYSPQGAISFGTCLGQGGAGTRSIAADAAGNIVIAGGYNGSLLIGASVISGQNDLYVAKLNPSGNGLWAKTFGDNNPTYFQGASKVVVDASGNLLLAGSFQNGLDMGGGALAAPSTFTVLVAKLSGAGQHIWSKAYGAAGNFYSEAQGMGVNAAGEVLVSGNFQGNVDFGGGVLVNAGDRDLFLLKLGSAGNHLSSQGFGAGDNQLGYSCAFDSTGYRLVTGSYANTIDFGNGPLPATVGGLTGVLVAKLAP